MQETFPSARFPGCPRFPSVHGFLEGVPGAPRGDFFNVRGNSDEGNRAYDEGMRLMTQHQVNAAREKFEEASKLDPKHPRVWAALALTYLVSGNTERAFELFRRQLKEAPSVEAYKILGMTQMQMHRTAEAAETWTR